MKPCVKCLAKNPKRILAGENRSFRIFQCANCSFNITAKSWEEAEKAWNNFKVWTLVERENEEQDYFRWNTGNE